MGIIDQPGLLQRHLITVDEFYRMAEAGVLAPDARVELIEGEVIDMAPMNSRHAAAVRVLNQRLLAAVGEQALVSCQLPLRLSERSEPEPDLMLTRPQAGGYRDRHPGAADVVLLIEVSDSSLRYDRGVKLPLYARHGVPEVWIVDLENRLVRFYRRPGGDAYADITASETPGLTALPGLAEVRVDLTGLLG
jgi:Uma2 family endonuclease